MRLFIEVACDTYVGCNGNGYDDIGEYRLDISVVTTCSVSMPWISIVASAMRAIVAVVSDVLHATVVSIPGLSIPFSNFDYFRVAVHMGT